VTAAGLSTTTNQDGTYVLDNVPAGVQTLVAFCADGRLEPFVQGARVAINAFTPADFTMAVEKQVKVTFNVKTPSATIPGAPLRMVGTLSSLGDAFEDLSAGLDIRATGAPVLTRQSGNDFSLTLTLPAGLDLYYKYTLGDGLWNSERTNQGGFKVRELIVPETDTTVTDSIETWNGPSSAAITFNLNVQEHLPSDPVFLQFDPYAWTEPVPMWDLGNGQWAYVLFNPQEAFSTVQFRFCQDEACTNVAQTNGVDHFSQSGQPQTLNLTVENWAADSSKLSSPDLALK
jgi:hypothetical protein